MWIEKTPRPWDFCGNVGCPICYGWGEDLRVEVTLTVEVTREVPKEAPAPPDFDERMLLVYGPDVERPKTLEEYKLAHAYVARELKKEEEERLAQEREANDNLWLQRQITADRKRKQKAQDYKPLNTVTCDSIGGEAIEQAMKDAEKARMVTLPPEKQQGKNWEELRAEQQAYLNKQRVEEQLPEIVRPWD